MYINKNDNIHKNEVQEILPILLDIKSHEDKATISCKINIFKMDLTALGIIIPILIR